MWHYSQVQLWSGQQSTEPGSLHHHRGYEINADSGAGNNHMVPVTWWSHTAKPGCQIQETARPPYEAETVIANKGETEEGEFHPPEQNTWTTTGRHPWSWPQRDSPMSCHSCLEWGNFPHHSVYHPRYWSERLPKRPWEKVPRSGIPSNPLPERVLDSCVHRRLCWECSSEWRGRSLHPGGREEKISLATGLYSTNYKAVEEALKTAAAHTKVSTHASHSVVLLSDALLIL